MPLEDKSIVVTGGNTGIGKAIVLAAAAEGTNVVVDYVMHPEYTAEVIAAAGRAGGCAVGVEADASRTDDLRRLIEDPSMPGTSPLRLERRRDAHARQASNGNPELVKRLEETIPLGRIATRFIRADHAYPHDRKAAAPARPSTSGDG